MAGNNDVTVGADGGRWRNRIWLFLAEAAIIVPVKDRIERYRLGLDTVRLALACGSVINSSDPRESRCSPIFRQNPEKIQK